MFLHISQFQKSKNNIVSQFQSESVYVKHLKEEHNCTPEDLEEAEVNIKSCFVLYHILHPRPYHCNDWRDGQTTDTSQWLHAYCIWLLYHMEEGNFVLPQFNQFYSFYFLAIGSGSPCKFPREGQDI